MIRLIIAVGEKGEFGSTTSKTGLPWTCKEDIESLFYNLQGSDTILVGAKTWFGMPERAKERAIANISTGNNIPSLHLYDPKDKYSLEALAEMEKWGSKVSVAVLPAIKARSYSRITQDSIVSCIGGRALAKHLLSEDLVDVAIVNRIKICETHPEFLAESVSGNTLEAEIGAFEEQLGSKELDRVRKELREAGERPFNTLELSMNAQRYLKYTQDKELYRAARSKFISSDVFFEEFSLRKIGSTPATVYLNPTGTSAPSEDSPVYFTSELWIFK